MKYIKEFIGYLIPMQIETRVGTVNPYLEIASYKGQYQLNSRTVNYSYGGLHLIFEKFFQNISIERFAFKNVLILGMGAGSIITILREKYGISCPITAVEKDTVVIELAEKYFNIRRHYSLLIVQGDAYHYVTNTKEKFDVIISDLFVDSDVPGIFASNEYLLQLKRISNNKCCIIYNKMTQKLHHKKESFELYERFKKVFPTTERHTLSAGDAENSLLYFNSLDMRNFKTGTNNS